MTKNYIYDYLENSDGKQPDGTFEYSNFGTGLLGHLLEIKTNNLYEELVKQRLLNELNMYTTFVTMDSTNENKLAQGYDENGNPAPVWTDKVLTGAGSFLSNGSGMIKFLKANLGEQESRISKSLTKTHQQQLNSSTGLGWILPGHIDKLFMNRGTYTFNCLNLIIYSVT